MDTSDRMMLEAVTALTDQIEKLRTYLKEREDKVERVEREIPMREQQEAWVAGGQGDLLDQAHRRLGQAEARRRRRQVVRAQQRPQQLPLDPDVFDATEDDQEPSPPRQSRRQRFAQAAQQTDLAQAYSGLRANEGRFKSALGAFAILTPPLDTGDTGGNQGADASTPPNASGPQGVPGATSSTVNSVLGGQGSNQDTSMLSWALLGEHGGPAWARNLALERYGLQRTIGWSMNAAQGLRKAHASDSMLGKTLQKIPGINDTTLGATSGFLKLAADHPNLAFGAYMGIQGGQKMFANMRENQTVGQSLGYGPPALGQTILGFHNPLGDFSTAARVGTAANLETQALEGRIPGYGFGSGLSKVQSQETMSTLMGQGWGMQPIGGKFLGSGALGAVRGDFESALSSIPMIGGPLTAFLSGILGGGPHGDAATIGQNFFEPLLQQYPGLSPQELGQFTPALRNSGTSIEQLTSQLMNLGMEARTSKETINEYTTSLAQTGKAFEALGSTPQGGYAIGTGFTNTTGLDPQLAAQFAQSPMFQGMMMSRYGILPSGLGDMNSGAFAGGALNTVQMLAKATQGLNRTVTRNVHGYQMIVQNGRQAQIDQIAQMSGIPANIVSRMLRDQKGVTARTNAQTELGDPTSNTGFWAYLNKAGKHLNNQQYKYAEKMWKNTVGESWRGTGVSEQEMHRIDAIKGMRQRAEAYSKALSNASKNDKVNQLQNHTNGQNVYVQFTGLAAKYFQQASGPSQAKTAANGGGPAYSYTANSITGDTTSPPPHKVIPGYATGGK